MIRLRDVPAGDERGLWPVAIVTVARTFREVVESAIFERMCARAGETNAWPRSLATPDHLTIVAVDVTGEVAGYVAAAGPRPDQPGWDGERSGPYVLKECQRRGFGRRLVREVAPRMAQSSHGSMAVWPLAQNSSSCRSHAALDARLIEERRIVDGDPTDAAVYGWRDTAALRAPA
jgi:GNAT superfamily N-acetyltransferase